MKADFEHLLAPTDCRFRTDIKALERGDLGWLLIKPFFVITFVIELMYSTSRRCCSGKTSTGGNAA